MLYRNGMHLMGIGVFLLFLTATSSAQNEWVWRNPYPTGNILYSVAWAGNQWVAVGETGAIYTSVDGETWTKRNSGTSKGLRCVLWTGSMLMAVGDSGVVATSSDGLEWTARQSPAISNIFSLTWNGSQFVAMEYCFGYLTSLDGIEWTEHSKTDSVSDNCFDWVLWTGTQFIAVGFYGRIYTSPNATDWTGRTSATIQPLHCAANSKDLMVVAGESGTILTSPDGEVWTHKSSGTTASLRGAVWTGSRFIVTGDSGVVLTSTDGSLWTRRNSGTSSPLYSVAWNGKGGVAVGWGAVVSTADGSTWTCGSGSVQSLSSVCWTGDGYFAVGGQSPELSSPDGVAWSVAGTGDRFGGNRIVWTGDRFLALGILYAIGVSFDGVTWNYKSIGIDGSGYAGVRTDSLYVILGSMKSSPAILTSPDGNSWKTYYLDTAKRFNDLIIVGKKLFTVGYDRYGPLIGFSYDGYSWVTANIPKSGDGYYTSLSWTGSELVATGGQGALALSTDTGITWKPCQSGVTVTLKAAARLDTQLVVVGYNGTILTSKDGAQWTKNNSVTSYSLNAIAASNRRAVVVGDYGTILTLSSGVTSSLLRPVHAAQNRIPIRLWQTSGSVEIGIDKTAAVGTETRLTVVDMSGRRIAAFSKTNRRDGQERIVFSTHGLPEGIYVLVVEGKNVHGAGRFIIAH